MRTTFEVWAQNDGLIVRRREDKPEEYLVSETQRRWTIWQAALVHGKPGTAKKSSARLDQAALRERVLNEVLDACSDLSGKAAMEELTRVIEGLKKKQKALSTAKAEGFDNAL